MAYALSVKHVTGRTLKCAVQDVLTGLYWDEVGNAWVASVTADCKVAVTEDGTHKGFYAGSASDLNVVKGGVYKILVYDSNDADFLLTSIITIPAKTETLLEVVNGVQRSLRMPISAGIADQLSLSIIQRVNDVLKTILPVNGIQENTKISGTFTLKSGVSLYRVAPPNVNTVDSITYLSDHNGSRMIGPMSPEDFRNAQGVYLLDMTGIITPGIPRYFKVASKDSGYPIVEVFPAPDDYYTVSYEAVSRMDKVSTATEYVPHSEIVRIAATMMMKTDMGRDATLEKGLLSEALSLASTTEANSHISDVEV